jgi:hypothetical protein
LLLPFQQFEGQCSTGHIVPKVKTAKLELREVFRTIPLPSLNVGGFTKDIFGPLIQALPCAKKLDMTAVLF